MVQDALKTEILEIFYQTLSEDGSVAEKPIITNSTILLESGLDSLGFAILVTRLEQKLGVDPFSLMETPYYPTTFGEFFDIYEKFVDHG